MRIPDSVESCNPADEVIGSCPGCGEEICGAGGRVDPDECDLRCDDCAKIQCQWCGEFDPTTDKHDYLTRSGELKTGRWCLSCRHEDNTGEYIPSQELLKREAEALQVATEARREQIRTAVEETLRQTWWTLFGASGVETGSLLDAVKIIGDMRSASAVEKTVDAILAQDGGAK